MRKARPASIQSAVQSSIRAAGGLEAAANDLGVGVSTLSHGTEISESRPGGLGINYADRLGRVVPEAAVPIAQHFAMLAGGTFQPLVLDGPTASDIHQLTREFSDVLQQHAAAHSSNSATPDDYTPAEAEQQIRELNEVIATASRFRSVLCAKAGERA